MSIDTEVLGWISDTLTNEFKGVMFYPASNKSPDGDIGIIVEWLRLRSCIKFPTTIDTNAIYEYRKWRNIAYLCLSQMADMRYGLNARYVDHVRTLLGHEIFEDLDSFKIEFKEDVDSDSVPLDPEDPNSISEEDIKEFYEQKDEGRKLVLITAAMVVFWMITQPCLVGLKVAGAIDLSWLFIFIPSNILIAYITCILFLAGIVNASEARRKRKLND